MRNKNLILSILFSVLFLFLSLPAQNIVKTSINKIAADTTKLSKFNINNISTNIYNNGNADIKPNGNSGLVYPKNSGATAIFTSGLLWGGKVDGEIRVGGTAYRTGLKPGKVLSDGFADDPEGPSAGVYRVRPDYKTADFSSEIKDGEGTSEKIKALYENDWNNWPASNGAPFTDKDGDGIYNPSIDIPGVPGAAQTLWFVANDLDSNQTKFLYGSTSIGLEVQVTIWGYTSPVLDHMFFKKYKLINKGGKDVTDMYFGIWSDPDLGDAGDDFVGCDTLLNLAFCYNARPQDNVYKTHGNLPPPALGFALLEGPKVDASTLDSAYFDGKIIYGKKNRGMTSFVFFAGGHPDIGDPPQGNYDGTRQLYNFLRGRYGISGMPFNIPEKFGGGITSFFNSGDPVTGQGWIDGLYLPSGDRRMMGSSGPFTLAAADTQEIVFAEIGAGAENNIGNIEAISYLRNYTATANELFKINFKSPQAPPIPEVKANAYDQKAVLTWGENVNESSISERSVFGNYGFQGYNVYQFSSPDFATAKSIKVATFDLVDSVSTIYDYVPDTVNGSRLYTAVQKGTNTGLQRYFIFDKDYFTGLPLHNGTKYYFAVTSYNFNPNYKVIPSSLENTPNIFTVIPQEPLPGLRYGANVNDILPVTHTKGNSDETVSPVVINPADINGHKYKVTFKNSGGNLLWELTDVTDNIKLLSGQEYKFNKPKSIYVTDGFIIKITDYNINTNTADDEFTFTTPTNTNSESIAKADVEKVNVFPNPYYGNNPNEETSYGKFITFSHLPQKATIRIFDLAGRLINTLNKDNNDQFLRYQLITQAHTPLASGIYIAYIEMPELDVTKILKFAVVQPQVVPDHY